MSQENKKVFRVILQVPNREALTQLLREHHLDLSCGGPRLQPDGTVTLEAYVGSDILNQLRQTMQMQLHQADSDPRRFNPGQPRTSDRSGSWKPIRR
jgi:iron-sulfur cluster repair protein YtfE (RIC family)